MLARLNRRSRHRTLIGSHLTRSPSSRAKNGRPGSQLISLNNVILSVDEALPPILGEQIKVERRLYDQLDPVLGDSPAFQRLVLALARSAHDGMPKGGTLTIETDTVFLDQDFVERWPGMTAGAYSMLQISDTRPVRRDPGHANRDTSPDMEEARIIAEKFGGRVEVELVTGTGRLVRVYFRAIDADGIGAPIGQTRPGAETVLLVEDTESLREMIQRVLTGFGYSVITAQDGAQALDVADSHPENIDLLLSDVVMPGIGGPELAVRLRMRRPNIRVLLMSGYDEHSLASSTGRYSSFIAKPFRPDALAKKVRELLDQPSAGR
jgi:two-component system, cell cycle sensor histidine kinase and response regulator CckA